MNEGNVIDYALSFKKYKKDYATFIQKAQTICPNRVFTSTLTTFAYGVDASCYSYTPKVVVWVYNELEVVEIIRLARACETPITFRAAGSSLSGQASSDSILIVANDGFKQMEILDNGNIRVNMSKPILESNRIPFIPQNNLNYKISVMNRIFEGNAVSMGNPHFVIFIKDDEDLLSLAKTYGPEIEISAEFPEKTNVEFVKINNSSKIELCVWERGCGITLACGTGACASVTAGILNGILDNIVEVKLPGGVVNVEWQGFGNDIFLTGPAEYVFEAKI